MKLIILVVLFVGLVFAPPYWPNWKYDRQLTGRCPYYGPTRDSIIWTFTAPDTFSIRYAAPVIGADGTIYFSSPDSFIFAIRSNGTEKWRYRIGGCVPGWGPAMDQSGRLYFNTTDYRVVALDDSGTYARLVWQRDCSTNSTTFLGLSPIVVGSDKTVYARFDSLYAIDSLGNRKWAFTTGLNNGYPPALSLDGEYLYYEYSPDPFSVYIAKRRIDGTLIWTHYIGGAPSALTWASPCIDSDSTIYFASADNYLHAIRPDNSNKWLPVQLLGNMLYVTPSLGLNDTIWYMNRQKRPNYWKISPDNGTKVLEDTITYTPSRYNYNSFTIDASGRAFIALVDSAAVSLTLYLFEKNGAINWTRTIPLEGRRTYLSYPAMAPGRFYLIGGNKLYAFQGSDIGVSESKVDNHSASLEVIPNPCSEKVKIRINPIIPFELKIYDSSGRLVRTYESGKEGVVFWDGKDKSGMPVKSGVYFCQVNGYQFRRTTKVVLIRDR